MSTLKNLALLAVVCGSAYVLYRNRKTLLQLFTNRRADVNPKKDNQIISKAMQEVCQAFIVYADNFQGLYEPLYKASQGVISQERKYNLLTEWNIRMNNIMQIPIGLKSWWTTIVANLETLSDEELQKRATLVWEMIKSSGIIRDNRKELTAEDDTSMYYQNAEGKIWEVGQKLHIDSPCWYIQSTTVRVVEKGYCDII